MSGFYLLALTAIWLFAGWLIYHFWKSRRPQDFPRRIVHIIIGVLLFSVWFGSAFWEVAGKKMYWDAKVQELCEKDGGVKVYETVELPADQFDKWGMVHFYQPDKGKLALGTGYLLKYESLRLREDNPIVIQNHIFIFRKEDERMLGESILYERGGGDIPGFWHPSGFTCPSYKDAGVNTLIKSIFITSSGGNK